MNKDLIKEKILFLKDVSAEEWKYIKIIIDRAFEKKIKELEKNIKLSDHNEIDNIIRSLFG